MPSDAEVSLYTNGACWRLAKALHDETGWPMLAVGYEGEFGIGWSHVVVRRPDGKYVDAEGAHEDWDLLDRYGPIVEEDEEGIDADLIEIPLARFDSMLGESADAVTAEDRTVARAVAAMEGV